MAGILSSFITPAVVAGVISLLVTNRNEKIRARRDFITKAFDPARDTIKAAVDAALEYYPLKSTARTKLLEAKVLASEREVRRAISALLSFHENLHLTNFSTVQDAFDNFVAEITGGSFQRSDAGADVATATKIADAGAHLRAALLSLRSDVLEREIENDPLSSLPAFWQGLRRSFGR